MKQIAILIPCLNEQASIAQVIHAFRQQLPDASIYVYDNGSTDRTAEMASGAGAIVRAEPRRGKGNVIRSMFQQINADVYVMVDGDATYPASAVHRLMAPILSGEADMVVGSRLHPLSRSHFHELNRWGNHLFLKLLAACFGPVTTDLLSGYRAFSRLLVKSMHLEAAGFEIETELTVRASAEGYRIADVPVDLKPRGADSYSKIRRVQDGFRILTTILRLFHQYRLKLPADPEPVTR